MIDAKRLAHMDHSILVRGWAQSYESLDESTIQTVHRVSKKTSTHIISYKLRNSCPILIIFDIKIHHII